MSSKTLHSTNRLLEDYGPLAQLLKNSDWLSRLASAEVDWEKRLARGLDNDIKDILSEYRFVATATDEPAELTETGLSFLGKILVDLRSIENLPTPILGRYLIDHQIAYGKNSITFKVRHAFLDRHFVLKVIRPGSGWHLENALKALGRLEDNPHLVQPLDYFMLPYHTVSGGEIQLQCIIYPYVSGNTLREFLSKSPPLSPYFVSALIDQLVGSLASLEKIGASHGDLHADNILVRQPSQGRVTFQIIDMSYGVGTPSDYRRDAGDFQHFQEHLWKSLEILQRAFPGMSLQKHLGARIYSIVDFILRSRQISFVDLQDRLRKDSLYSTFVAERDRFIQEKFRVPSGLYLLRYEEFTNPKVAIELFEPFPGLLNKLSNFGNVLLYGHRGSGKSTYLAALAFFPEIEQPAVQFTKILGIFFACRQGEFKQFSSELVEFDRLKMLNFKHILVLKIIRRLVHSLSEAVRSNVMSEPSSYDSLYTFLRDYVACGDLGSYDNMMVTALENLYAELLRGEILEIDLFFERGQSKPTSRRSLDEKSLIDLLLLVKSVFPDLSAAQFFLLFDDAGSPNVPYEAQKVINELALATNSVYCVKLSAERYSYIFEDASGKALEDPHDISVYDISQELFLGSGNNPDRDEVEEYFKQILRRRLSYWKYQSFNICDYLGDDLISIDSLVEALASGRRNAYFAGWEVVWQLADRTVRNLLEIVNAIFAEESVDSRFQPKVVTARVQSGAVKSVSERKLRALSYIPGRIDLFGREIALGRRLYEFTAAFGAVAQAYLKRGKRSHGERFDERIAVERNDFRELSQSAQSVLEALIRFGILDDSHLAFSRDDKLKKPLYILNRIFCPAFGISLRRDQHLRLTTGKFELFLLDPIGFARSGTRFLEKYGSSSEVNAYDLFE